MGGVPINPPSFFESPANLYFHFTSLSASVHRISSPIVLYNLPSLYKPLEPWKDCNYETFEYPTLNSAACQFARVGAPAVKPLPASMFFASFLSFELGYTAQLKRKKLISCLSCAINFNKCPINYG